MVKKLPLLPLLLIACTSIIDRNSNTLVTKVIESGVDAKSGEFCKNFSLTKKQAQQFFNNAKRVALQDITAKASFLPCYVTGEAVVYQEKCDWEIRAGGTAQLMCGEEISFFLCEDCF